ncbi:NADH:flavin oxidoreductase [Paenibacillus sepulcri]|uniref:NADH:flavin oxidoreductase n=1 Tax=Paenibacillus sepulcri TaxID=359917 RepID=A0ABS7BZ56_9BACL|nr:NADH:flavin oxidoreductase [Paenibacillus sepulcri]
MSTFPQILSTYQLGRLTLKNRVVLAPMTRGSAESDGRATENMARYYARFASGDFGLVITESGYMDDTFSQGLLNQPGITKDSHIQAWKGVTEAVHAQGGKIILQLAHAGALSQVNPNSGQTVAPSALKPEGERSPLYGKGGEFPTARALDIEEIKELIGNFAKAASNAEKAGFDGVEIHSASGFLPDQFLTGYTNQRTDEYGGSLENRLRFLIETIEAVKAATGEDFVVGVRISQAKVNNFTYKWEHGEEDARVIFESIGAAKADYIHTYEYRALDPAFEESGPTLAELAKKYGNTAVIANGGLDQPADAAKMLEKGSDLIALAKAALSNHDWPKKVQNGQPIEPFTGDVLTPTPTLKEKELLN